MSRPLSFLPLSFVFSFISVFFSFFIFPTATSLLSISFLVIFLTPLFYALIEREEMLAAHTKHKNFFKRYEPVILSYAMIALGVLLAFSLMYMLLPSNPAFTDSCMLRQEGCSGAGCYIQSEIPCREAVFSVQENNSGIFSLSGVLILIILAFILSLFFGAGALLILVWDITLLAFILHTQGLSAVLMQLPRSFAFFFAGLSGALLSVAVVRHEWRSHSFMRVIFDAAKLLILSLILLIPLLFYA
jgi:hypothetical protein